MNLHHSITTKHVAALCLLLYEAKQYSTITNAFPNTAVRMLGNAVL